MNTNKQNQSKNQQKKSERNGEHRQTQESAPKTHKSGSQSSQKPSGQGKQK